MLGCSNLGSIEKASGNSAKAKELYTKACRGGGAPGCANLSFLELEMKNTSLAFKKIDELCKQGSNDACKALVEMGKHGK
jgi:TPR repeat protein